MSNSFNNSGMIVNPVLSTFPADEINIQPYWTVVLGLLFSQLFQRIWHFFKYKTGFTALEIAGLIGIFRNRLEKQPVPVAFAHANSGKSVVNLEAEQERLTKLRSMLAISYFDAISCLLTLGHAIWYCVIQANCIDSSSSIATPWNCYNALGYRLFNYVFVSYFTTTLDCVYKAYMLGYKEVMETDAKRGSFGWVMHYATLITISLALLFTTCLMLPYILTNVLPMFVIYIWMAVIYIGFCVYLVFSGFKLHKDVKDLPAKVGKDQSTNEKDSSQHEFCSFMFSSHEIPQVALCMMLAMVITTFPILLSIFFNYTQFFYYGETYLKSIGDDANSRSTMNYFNGMKNSVAQIMHSVLTFL